MIISLGYRKNLSEQMSSRASELDVALLLFAIQKTSAFEKQLGTKYYLSKYMRKVREGRREGGNRGY